jgi:hypothetical protein
MAKILLVHGMRMEGDAIEKKMYAKWPNAVRRCLAASDWGRKNPDRAAKVSIDVAYWGDLFRRPAKARPEPIWKGPPLEPLKDLYCATLRRAVRLADRMSVFNAEGRPRPGVAPFVDSLVQQSAVYMNNGPVFNPTPGVPNGAFPQVQHRFFEKLTCADHDDRADPPSVVIGHSLGSVIAYEGLCTISHAVRALVTIGSPLATPRLILDPLRSRLGAGQGDLPWPGVHRWDNFYAAADVLCVPVKRLAPLFPGRPVHDHQVRHGTVKLTEKAAHETHRLETYLKHPQIGDAIGHGLDLGEQKLPPLPKRR